jgi:molybdopterin-guanine dinucleotide biosynthesis protein A
VKKNITGLILAGGNALRMGGVDKGLVVVKGQFLVSFVIERMKSQVDSLMINANRNIDLYDTLSPITIQDMTSERLGPLAGIQAGLHNCSTEYMISIPCDVPRIPINICNQLYLKLLEEDADCAMPVTYDGDGLRRTHPAILLLKKRLVHSLDFFLNSGGRKIDKWTGQLKTIEVLFDDASDFININNLNDVSNI